MNLIQANPWGIMAISYFTGSKLGVKNIAPKDNRGRRHFKTCGRPSKNTGVTVIVIIVPFKRQGQVYRQGADNCNCN